MYSGINSLNSIVVDQQKSETKKMLHFRAAERVDPQLVASLGVLLTNMGIAPKAYFGLVKLPEEQDFSFGLLICAAHKIEMETYMKISDHMAPYFQGSYVNIAPVPPGPWWRFIEENGVKVIDCSSQTH